MIERGKWIQDTGAVDANGDACEPEEAAACGWCLWGAIMRISHDAKFKNKANKAMNVLCDIIEARGEGQTDCLESMEIVTWNDKPGRTEREAVALLREGAQRAGARFAFAKAPDGVEGPAAAGSFYVPPEQLPPLPFADKVMSAADILMGAAWILQDNQWTQKWWALDADGEQTDIYGPEAVQFSMIGAMQRAQPLKDTGEQPGVEGRHRREAAYVESYRATGALIEAIRSAGIRGGIKGFDKRGRTKADIIAMLRAAAEIAKQSTIRPNLAWDLVRAGAPDHQRGRFAISEEKGADLPALGREPRAPFQIVRQYDDGHDHKPFGDKFTDFPAAEKAFLTDAMRVRAVNVELREVRGWNEEDVVLMRGSPFYCTKMRNWEKEFNRLQRVKFSPAEAHKILCDMMKMARIVRAVPTTLDGHAEAKLKAKVPFAPDERILGVYREEKCGEIARDCLKLIERG